MTSSFPVSTRGKVMGLWSTAASFGNIFGILTYTLFTNQLNLAWEEVIITTATAILTFSIIFKFLIVSPIESEELLPSSSLSICEV